MRIRSVLSLAFVAAAALGGIPATALAAAITYTASATGTFSLGATAYENRLVTLTVTGDTAAAPNSGAFQTYSPGPVTISIAGVGDGIASDLGVFVNQSFPSAGSGAVGFGNLNVATFLALVDAAASTYNLNQAFGPVTGTNFIRDNVAFVTTLGNFQWRSAGPATFSAAVNAAVPEPGTLALLGLGLMGLGWSRRRKA